MSVWLHIIGVGDNGVGDLPSVSRTLIDKAEFVVAPKRVRATLPQINGAVHTWTSPLDDMVGKICGWRGRRTVVLATGDPTYYGIGNTFARHGIPVEETHMIPAPSAFSLACARLGWAQQEAETVSLHGRPDALIAPLIQPGAKILALTAGEKTVHAVAAMLIARGFANSCMTVLEHMGGERERVVPISPRDADTQRFAAFSTLAVDCVAGPDAVILPRIAGLPDHVFFHDGQLTKREVRAATLAALAPMPGGLLWDVGAGCGSIAVEWARAAPNATAICFENNEQRAAMIADNALAFGVPHIDIVAGPAPGTLDGKPAPDAIFIGGGLSEPDLFEACWSALKPGGRIVANAVSVEGEARLLDLYQTQGGHLSRIAVSRAEALGGLAAFRPLMPVTQWQHDKPHTQSRNGKKND